MASVNYDEIDKQLGFAPIQQNDAVDYDAIDKQLGFDDVDVNTDSKVNNQPEKSGLLRKIKHLILGVTDIADLPNALSEVSKLQANTARAMNPPVDWGDGVDFGEANIVEEAPRIPSLSEDVLSPAIDKATGGLTAGEPDAGDTALRYASAIYSPAAMASKVGSKAAKAASFISSKRPADVAGAALMGGATQGLEDLGVDPTTSAVGGLAAGIAPAFAKKKLSPKIDMEAYEANKKAGTEFHRVQVDKSKRAQIAQVAGEHSILAANKLKKESEGIKKSYQSAFERELDKTSTKVTPEKQALKEQLYDESEKALTKSHVTSPENTNSAFESASQSIKDKALASEDEAKLIERINSIEKRIGGDKLSQIIDKSGNRMSLEDFKNNKTGNIAVKTLVDRKRKINAEVNKILGSKNPDYDLASALRSVNSGIKKDIAAFAEKNPKDFGEKWLAAEKLHGDMATRESLDKKLGFKELVKAERDFNPQKMAENYLNVRNDKEFQRLIGGRENLKHWDDIVSASRTLPDSKVSTLSKSMKIMAVLAVTANFATSGSMSLAKKVVGGLAADDLLSRYLGNKKVLERAAAAAKNPSAENAKKFNNTLKAELGLSARELMARIESNQGDSDKKDKDKTQAKVTFKGSPGTEFIV